MALDIQFLVVGKTRERWLLEGLGEYEKRLSRYCRYRRTELQASAREKARPETDAVQREGQRLLQAASADHLILLDAAGRSLDSPGLADYLQRLEAANRRKLTFAAGGAWGFSAEVYGAAAEQISLSPLTLNHQMVRLLFVEQLYRAFSLLAGEPYHHA
jgi:23S rRNA (pseudouridine1915-N3)-methyltransferase